MKPGGTRETHGRNGNEHGLPASEWFTEQVGVLGVEEEEEEERLLIGQNGMVPRE